MEFAVSSGAALIDVSMSRGFSELCPTHLGVPQLITQFQRLRDGSAYSTAVRVAGSVNSDSSDEGTCASALVRQSGAS